MMNRKGIANTYRGRRYRSLLETKWAAFFQQLGIEFEYEPFELNGWIPDFYFPNSNTLVEIKPFKSFCGETAAKILAARGSQSYQLLMCGYRPNLCYRTRRWATEPLALGWLDDGVYVRRPESYCPWHAERFWSLAAVGTQRQMVEIPIWQEFAHPDIGFLSPDFTANVEAGELGSTEPLDEKTVVSYCAAKPLWDAACNEAQWKGDQSTAIWTR